MSLVDAMYGTCTKDAHMSMRVQHRVDDDGDNVQRCTPQNAVREHGYPDEYMKTQVQSRQACRCRFSSRAPGADWLQVVWVRTVNASGGRCVTMGIKQAYAIQSNSHP